MPTSALKTPILALKIEHNVLNKMSYFRHHEHGASLLKINSAKFQPKKAALTSLTPTYQLDNLMKFHDRYKVQSSSKHVVILPLFFKPRAVNIKIR